MLRKNTQNELKKSFILLRKIISQSDSGCDMYLRDLSCYRVSFLPAWRKCEFESYIRSLIYTGISIFPRKINIFVGIGIYFKIRYTDVFGKEWFPIVYRWCSCDRCIISGKFWVDNPGIDISIVLASICINGSYIMIISPVSSIEHEKFYGSKTSSSYWFCRIWKITIFTIWSIWIKSYIPSKIGASTFVSTHHIEFMNICTWFKDLGSSPDKCIIVIPLDISVSILISAISIEIRVVVYEL